MSATPLWEWSSCQSATILLQQAPLVQPSTASNSGEKTQQLILLAMLLMLHALAAAVAVVEITRGTIGGMTDGARAGLRRHGTCTFCARTPPSSRVATGLRIGLWRCHGTISSSCTCIHSSKRLWQCCCTCRYASLVHHSSTTGPCIAHHRMHAAHSSAITNVK